MKTITLSNGELVKVSDEHYEWLNHYHWGRHSWGYAQTNIKGKKVLMHRLVIGATEKQQVDHIDRNPLNNTLENLRICTGTQNQGNTKKRKDNTIGYRGVTRQKRAGGRNKYSANIMENGKRIYLGLFDTPEEAAIAWDNEALKYFGSIVSLNFPA